MKKIIGGVILFCMHIFLYAQKKENQFQDTIKVSDIVIIANRVPFKLKNVPGAVSLVNQYDLKKMPKSIGAEEALRLVPGVHVENQHDGERVHISIRGQGILTERGLRGIGVLLDGIPLSDPSGFVPDLYDIDWDAVKTIEILRGPQAGLYGSSGNAGILNIKTFSGNINGVITKQTIGSNGFQKTFINVGGKKDSINYNIYYSKEKGDGYRLHQAFRGDKLYETIKMQLSKSFSVTQIMSHVNYFQQNPEGLNYYQLADPKQANPDACPYNEYQKTNRITLGVHGRYSISRKQNLHLYTFMRSWNYKETSNKSAEYRHYDNLGAGLEYHYSGSIGKLYQDMAIGGSYNKQLINMYQLASEANRQREEKVDEITIETDSILSNQMILQESKGLFGIYRIVFKRFHVVGNLRYDNLLNSLLDKKLKETFEKNKMSFVNLSYRIGANYSLSKKISLFTNYSKGFMPPTTEELASNPLGYGGFNTHLIPAENWCYELGSRGNVSSKIYYDITIFLMQTQNDFFRFKQLNRGNQEVFYGNAGNSQRLGVETYWSVYILPNLNLQMTYTYSDFRYIGSTQSVVYMDTNYVLTIPPKAGQYLPNSPKHQFYAELTYRINSHLSLMLAGRYQSSWAIYTDPRIYEGRFKPEKYKNWQSGFNLYNAKISYEWMMHDKWESEVSFYVRNFTGTKYIAFTEPDSDGNSYHPAPTRQFFISLKIKI